MDKDTRNAADSLLQYAYSLSDGDVHKPIDMKDSGRETGLSSHQMLLLLSHLVDHGYLIPSSDPHQMALFLTEKAIEKMAAVRTRQ